MIRALDYPALLDRHEASIEQDIAADEQVAAKPDPDLGIAAWLSDDPDEVRAALDIAEDAFNLAHIRLLRARLLELADAEPDDEPSGFRAMYYAIKL